MGIKMGIEIEYLVMRKSDGRGIWSGYRGRGRPGILGPKILRDAAKRIGAGVRPAPGHKYTLPDRSHILPDTFSLLETVTPPSTDLVKLGNMLWNMKNALIHAAAQHGCLVSGAACPIAYKYDDPPYTGITRNTYNNAGMHVHLEALDDRVKIKLANLIAQVIPELVALSANSPIYNKIIQKTVSTRLDQSPLTSAEKVQVLRHDPDTPLQLDAVGQNRYRFVTVYTHTKNTIEVRGIDTPITVDWAIAVAALLQCLASKATRLFIDEKRNTPVGAKSVRIANFNRAKRTGLRARFKVDSSFHVARTDRRSRKVTFLYHGAAAEGATVPAHLAVKRLLYFVEDEAERVGNTGLLQPLYDAVRKKKNQADQQREWFEEGFDGFVARLQQAAATPFGLSRSHKAGRRYAVVRQRRAQGRDTCLYLAEEGCKRLKVNENDEVMVSGPTGSATLRIRTDREDDDPSTLPLAKEEVRLGAAVRRQLGVSLFDPVIVGQQASQPIVIRRCGPTWASAAGGSPRLKVRVGLRAEGPGKAVITTTEARRRSLRSGDAIAVIRGTRVIRLTLATDDRKTSDGQVRLMKKDRDRLEAECGDRVELGRAAGDKADARLAVAKGLGVDAASDRGIFVVRISPGQMRELGLAEGARVNLFSVTDGQQGIGCEARVKPAARLRKGKIALRRAAREQLGVELDGEVLLFKRGNL